MFVNREGSTQHYTNTPGHPNQFQAHTQSKNILYQWLPLIVKLQFLPGVSVPRSDTYTPRVREEDEIAVELRENFIVADEEPLYYILQEGDILTAQMDVIAHASECVLA